MRVNPSKAEYLAYLAERAQAPDVQALVNSWGPLEPYQLAVIARVFSRRTATRTEQAA